MQTPATVRAATDRDFEPLCELIVERAPGLDARAITEDLLEHGETFVLDADDRHLAAAARVQFEEGAAKLDFLMIADEASADIEARMIGIAEALASAYGCDLQVFRTAGADDR